MNNPRTAFFGLRSTVGYFRSRTGLAYLDLRLKSAALLYDHLLLEAGVYECTVTDSGSMAFVMPLTSEDQLQPLRTRYGAMAGFRVARDGSDQFTTLVSGATEARFRAQFYTPMRELEGLRANWVEHVSLTKPAEVKAGEIAGAWTWDEREVITELMPSASHWLRNRVHEGLNYDLAQALLVGAELLPDGSNAQLLRAKAQMAGVHAVTTGERALQIMVPDVRAASWADIHELRQHPGIASLRAKLRELDGVDLSDAAVRNRIQDELLREYEAASPRHRDILTSFLTLGIGLIPGAGALTEGVDAAKTVADVYRADRHWLATIISARTRLRARLEQTAASALPDDPRA